MDEEVKRMTRIHAALISRVQEDLRTKCRVQPDNADRIWKQHCQNQEALEEYASSMEFLARSGWNSWLEKATDQSRISWCRTFYRNYFDEERAAWEAKLTSRDEKMAGIHGVLLDGEERRVSLAPTDGRVRLLDVGSCYNPFRQYADTEAFGIDLAPAQGSGVAKCDFLTVPLGSSPDGWELEPGPASDGDGVRSISSGFFDVVVLSLVLSYLPTAAMRLACCARAYPALKPNGLLLVVTPDSKRRGKNDPMVKSWKIALSLTGFHRLVHEKLAHVQCMAFRKVVPAELERREGEKMLERFRNAPGCRSCEPREMMFIPQDFSCGGGADSDADDGAGNSASPLQFTGEEKADGFAALPLEVASDTDGDGDE